MNKLFTILVIFIMAFCVFAQTEKTEEEIDEQIFEEFQNFIKVYNITYGSSDEYSVRFDIFKDNYMRLDVDIKKTNKSHLSGITRFFDLTEQEFSKKFLNLDLPLTEVIKSGKAKGNFLERQNEDSQAYHKDLTKAEKDEKKEEKKDEKASAAEEKNSAKEGRKLQTTLPVNFDWRTYGVVSNVKNQGSCGSCWSFAATATIESRYALKYGVMENFSEQQIVNCDTNSNGCNGGSASSAYYYLMNSSGLVKESIMPYVGYEYTCNTGGMTPTTQITSYMSAGTLDEEYIVKMLYNYGPLSVAINAKYLQYYKAGIINVSNYDCNPYSLNHAVNLVGWGVEGDVKFWIVRNTWGSWWGESGYFRIVRGAGTCGINRYVTTVFLK